jgi:hypothetical protein
MSLSFQLSWSVCPKYTNTVSVGDLQDAVLACANITFIWTWTGGSLRHCRLKHNALSNFSSQQNLLFIYDQSSMAAFTRKIAHVGIYIPIFGTFIPALRWPLTVGQSWPGAERTGFVVDHPPPCSTKVSNRLELYLTVSVCLQRSVMGWTLPLPVLMCAPRI